MNAFQQAAVTGLDLDTLVDDDLTASLLERRGVRGERDVAGRMDARRRGWLVRRALLAADITALVVAYALAGLIQTGPGNASAGVEFAILLLTIPIWVVAAKLYGLYERDEEHVDHSTVDEVVGVFHLVTLGAWFYFVATWAVGIANHVPRLVAFWVFAVLLVTIGRGIARAAARKSPLYLQNTIIIGAGDIGQLAARKLLQHPEYRINLVGFVDTRPRDRRPELEHLALLGPIDRLTELITLLDIERVIVAFSDSTDEELVAMVRELRKLDVQIDVVPRLFEVVGPKARIHAFEGLPFVGLPPAKLSPSSRLLKRLVDCVVSGVMLIVLAPLMGLIAICIRLDSTGPILFRQRRLGYEMRPFTVLKFRTMRVDTDETEHRRYIERTLTHNASPNTNGLYKLDRSDAVTRVGRVLRKTSLDELPQLFNILRGDMSLVGPRPCLDYETEGFAEHHFDRFLVPPGLTGLWQVTARSRSTFGEALDMDVAYVRGWSLGLDLQLLLKTPFSLVRMRAAA
jgi:exopolysaccharide biosynthesis polyprenyl glycosylphosphotransferase